MFPAARGKCYTVSGSKSFIPMREEGGYVERAGGMVMKAYIFLRSGESPGEFYLSHYLRTRESGDKLVCADGGYSLAEELGLEPDFTIGDLDSISGSGIQGSEIQGSEIQVSKIQGSVIRYPAEKDFSDFELALRTSVDIGSRSLFVYGALGGRKDHELTNVLVAAGSPVPVIFVEQEVELYNVVDSVVLQGEKGTIVSLLAFGGPCFVRETKGLRYPLNRENLLPSSRGLSNVMTGEEARIRIRGGKLIVVLMRAAAVP
jgi:thiamine pyrophosphokinase